jgi:hypothetical protein
MRLLLNHLPANVRHSVYVFLFTLLLQLLSFILIFLAPVLGGMQIKHALMTFVGNVLVLAGFLYLVDCLTLRRNWARVCISIIISLTMLFLIYAVITHPSRSLVRIVAIVTDIFQFFATVLLFTPASNDWFSRRGNGPQSHRLS